MGGQFGAKKTFLGLNLYQTKSDVILFPGEEGVCKWPQASKQGNNHTNTDTIVTR